MPLYADQEECALAFEQWLNSDELTCGLWASVGTANRT